MMEFKQPITKEKEQSVRNIRLEITMNFCKDCKHMDWETRCRVSPTFSEPHMIIGWRKHYKDCFDVRYPEDQEQVYACPKYEPKLWKRVKSWLGKH